MAGSTTIQSARRQTKLLVPARPFAPIEAQIQRAIARIAESDCPVLIVGEHGVGKRTIAAQIHAQSHRSRSNFTEISSADADAQSILSAFSAQGTVYLTEIADLSQIGLELLAFVVKSL